MTRPIGLNIYNGTCNLHQVVVLMRCGHQININISDQIDFSFLKNKDYIK